MAMRKQCPTCGKKWHIDELIRDPEVLPIGMIVTEEAPVSGVYFFQHETPTCKTSFTVPIEAFEAHLTSPPPEKALVGSAHCIGNCRKLSQLEHCVADCRHAPYRRFILDLKKQREKSNTDDPPPK